MKTNYPKWDIKFYYFIHVNRQKSLWRNPVTYPQFYRRLRDGMTLHDAIYRPRVEYQVRKMKQTPIQDSIRRIQTLRAENVISRPKPEVKVIEKRIYPKPNQPMPNYNMKPKKKPSLRIRFISLFK